MDSGISTVMAKAFTMGAEQARTGEKSNYADAMKGATNNQLLSMSLFMYDPKYKSLRELTGLAEAFRSDPNGGENFGKAFGMKIMVNALDACHIQLSDLLIAKSAATQSSGGAPMAMDFGAVCTNPGDAKSKRTKSPSRDASAPLIMPDYPPISRRTNETGKVMLSVYVTDQGRIARARVATSSGFSRLDQAALEGARNWRLIPGELDNQPACMWVTIPVSFNLNDQDQLELTPRE
jgi:TonB family protein